MALIVGGSNPRLRSLFVFTPTTSVNVISGPDSRGAVLTYTPGETLVDVIINGVNLAPADYIATNGSSITLGTYVGAGDTIIIIAYAAVDIANTYSQAQSDGRFLRSTDNLAALTDKPLARANLGTGPLPQAIRITTSNEPGIPVTDFNNAALGSYADFTATGTHLLVMMSAEFIQPVAGAQTLYHYISIRDMVQNSSIATPNVRTQNFASGEAQGTTNIFHSLAMGGLIVGRAYRVELRYYKTNVNASLTPKVQAIEGMNF